MEMEKKTNHRDDKNLINKLKENSWENNKRGHGS
jgi:hypothetical protein